MRVRRVVRVRELCGWVRVRRVVWVGESGLLYFSVSYVTKSADNLSLRWRGRKWKSV